MRGARKSTSKAYLKHVAARLNADLGNVQLYNPKTQALEIVAQRGFGQEFLDYFRSAQESTASCGTALLSGKRVIVEDVRTEPSFTPHLEIAAAGFVALRSTPLFNRTGEPLGMISTYFRKTYRPSELELRFTDLYARQAAEMIERKRAEEKLQRSETYLAEGQRISKTGSWVWNVSTESFSGQTNNFEFSTWIPIGGRLRFQQRCNSFTLMIARVCSNRWRKRFARPAILSGTAGLLR